MAQFGRRALILGGLAVARAQGQKPLRLAIAGLTHGHASGFLRGLQGRADVVLVGVYDPDPQLHAKYGAMAKILPEAYFTSLDGMLDAVKPEAVGTFTSTYDHPMVVEACAKRGIPVMMEKPLAVSMADARRIQAAATKYNIPVLVNYETTWYRSHAELWRIFKQQTQAGDIRKMVAMDGHQGPKEIGVGPEFLGWLTDPVKNGGGALYDFGCYGANLMTWMMDNQPPLSVTARTLTAKPQIYAKVDDEATILLDYPKAQGIIQASWNWPFGRKDFEVYAEKGYAHAIGGNTVRARMPGAREESVLTPAELAADERDPISYLTAVARGRLKPSGLSSLENNMVATAILEAARESSKTGKTVILKR